MALSWTEIKDRALRFSNEWKDDTSEDAEAKSFWDDFFTVFGVTRRRLAQFEKAVERPGRSKGFVDLFWPGTLVVEHKSRGRSLDDAYSQAVAYFVGLKDHELPRYVLVSDFAHFRLYDLDESTPIPHEFLLAELHLHVREFGFMLGYQKRTYQEQDPVNIKAAQIMGGLHDKLKDVGYDGHTLEVYLVRLLFCLFADDTSIFDKGIFQDYLAQNTREDGFDLGAQMAMLFQILNTPADKRPRNLDDALAQFPYVNGKLFAENLMIPTFDRAMRQILLDCCALDWGRISPAIFGSLFQSVMNPVERRNLGAHYTSEKNILKVITPLFLDALRQEFRAVQTDRRKLLAFHKKLANLRFLDPACGCGNFLIITYRELRLLEIEVIKALQKSQQYLTVNDLVLVDVDRFCGIEYEEFPAQIAQVAMWLIDHQMNMRVSEEFGQYYVRLPLRKSATIVHGNALRTDWQSLLPEAKDGEEPAQYSFIIGNPPFVGAMVMNESQRSDMEFTFSKEFKGYGILDYVACWYFKAAKYISDTTIKVCLVSTNSVSQGEQVSILWQPIMSRYKIFIHFAHRTFKWSNEAKGNAAVHVVIVGFANFDTSDKYLFDYPDIRKDPEMVKVSNINPYLTPGKTVFLNNVSSPLSNVPPMRFGSMPRDGGHLIFTEEEKKAFLKDEPNAEKWIRPYTGAQEFINGYSRYCLWLNGISPNELRQLPNVLKRVEAVREFRNKSTASSTRKFAATPTLFCQIAQPDTDYLLIPRVSSERRKFIPVGFVKEQVIANDQVLVVPNANLFHFGILTSEMHMAWVCSVCGRLKSDYRYSKDIVYNNFPWPSAPAEKQVKAVETAAQRVLDVRASFTGSSLADLYDPLTMPPALVKAHQDLDRAVDLCYRPQPFPAETRRIEFLFELYEQYMTPLIAIGGKKKRVATPKKAVI